MKNRDSELEPTCPANPTDLDGPNPANSLILLRRIGVVQQASRNSTIVLSIVFLLVAVSSVAGNLSAHPWLHDLFTPLATICILALAVSNWRAFRKNYALWISIGSRTAGRYALVGGFFSWRRWATTRRISSKVISAGRSFFSGPRRSKPSFAPAF